MICRLRSQKDLCMKVPLKCRGFLLLALSLWSRMAQAEIIKIAIPSTTQAVLPFTIARDKGYYRAEGLDVELILMSAPIASRALLSGDVTVATVGGAGLPPVLRGSPFKFLFTTYNRAMFWLYAKPEIRDLKGLKNKRVGVSGIGSGPDSLLREILRVNGLDANRDVTVLSLGVMPTIFAGLQSGIVDAAMLSPPVTFKAQEAGFRELVSFPKQDLVELQGSVLVRDASLQSDPGANGEISPRYLQRIPSHQRKSRGNDSLHRALFTNQ